jgi:hypothetical protein
MVMTQREPGTRTRDPDRGGGPDRAGEPVEGERPENGRHAQAGGHGRGAGALSWLRRTTDTPLAPGLLVLAGALVFVLARLHDAAQGDIARFVRAERPFANPARVPPGLFVYARNGYDGQFYYRLALNPLNLHHTAYGITIDTPFRFQRIGYPVLGWLASAGQHALVPVAMVAVNVAAMTTIGLLGGVFAQAAGRHALWGALLASYGGLVSALGRDLTEPAGAAFMLGGLLALRRRHPVLAGLLLACAALTRETALVVAGAIGLARLVQIAFRRSRPGWPEFAWLAPLIAFGAWQLVLRRATGGFTLLASLSSNGKDGLPGSAFWHALQVNVGLLSSSQGTQADVWFLEVAALLLFAAAALTALPATTAPAYERLAFVAFVVELAFLSHFVWGGFADLRSVNEVYLLAVLILLAAPRRRLGALSACSVLTLLAAASYQVAFM